MIYIKKNKNEIDKSKKNNIKKIMNDIKVPIPKSKYQVQDKKFLRFIRSSVTLVFCFGLMIFLIYEVFFTKKFNVVYLMLFVFLSFILCGVFLYWLVVAVLAKIPKRVKKAYKTNLTQNFLIADFWLPQKRKIEEVVSIESNNTFLLGKKRYIVDEECIWFDENNFPHSNYIPNLPNPLKYDFKTLFDKLSDLMRKGIFYIKTKAGVTVDIVYSSEGLELFRKDKFLKDMHTIENPADRILIYILVGALVLIVIVAFAFLSSKNKQPEETTNTAKGILLIGGYIWQKIKNKK